MHTRPARADDAESACVVLRRSIADLCHADYGDHPAILDRWLANKTPENVADWIARPDNSVLVAVTDGGVVSVGAVTDAGDITLNYVAPEARFQGVSHAMLSALGGRARARGYRRCHLVSTETARRLYLRTAMSLMGHYRARSARVQATRCRRT